MPLSADGTCPIFLVPNKDSTKCVLPSRIDVAKHYLTFGGRDGLKESYESLVSRLQVFTGFLFKDLNDPVLAPLFKSESYRNASTDACGGKNIFDPIQLGIIITLPGQVVASHLDVPWYWGASRFNIPQWLLIAME